MRSPNDRTGNETSGRARSWRLCLVMALAAALGAAPAASPAAEGVLSRAGQTADTDPLENVHDPMLRPLPRPERAISSWEQGAALVRDNAPGVRVAFARTQQAEGFARQSLAALLPSLGVTGTLTQNLLLGEGTAFLASGVEQGISIPNPARAGTVALGLNVPLIVPRAWYDDVTAGKVIEASEASARDVERLTLGTLADAVVTVVMAERMAEIGRVSLGSALAVFELSERSAKLGGRVTELDVLRADQEVSTVRSQLLRTDEAVLKAREALGVALGDDHGQGWGVSPELRLDALFSGRGFACHPIDDVQMRDDVRGAKLDALVARRNVTSTGLSLLPTLQAASVGQYITDDLVSPNGRHWVWTVGGLLSWQLYDGGIRSGQRTVNEGLSRVADQRLRDTTRRARLEVTQARRSVQAAAAALEVSRRGRDTAARTARLSRVAYAGGLLTSLELVDAARRWREAELDLTLREFDLVRAQLVTLFVLTACDL
jgi:outer membrane protein TolC